MHIKNTFCKYGMYTTKICINVFDKQLSYRKSVICLLLVCIATFLYWDYKIDKYETVISAREELLRFMAKNQDECKNYVSKTHEMLTSATKQALMEYLKQPQCKNLLLNITSGQWVPITKPNKSLSEDLMRSHENYRSRVGIPLEQWRYDHRCGYNVKMPIISKTWPQVASFCNPKSAKPCCNSLYAGECVAVTKTYKCDCPTCIDTRVHEDARLSEWRVKDQRCQWIAYSHLEACAVLNKLSKSSMAADLHFVGDSLMRNMFMGLEMILKPGGNIRKQCISQELEKLCRGENTFVLRACHDLSAAHSLEDLNHNDGQLCNGQRKFHATYHNIAMENQKQEFLQLVKQLLGMPNKYIIIGIGLHFNLDHDKVINFLKPALELLNSSDIKWPRFLWVHPLSIGLLKPPIYHNHQGTEATDTYIKELKRFLNQNGIPSFDFRNITKKVKSYDGTHYGSGVNIMKAQIFLNYISSIS